MKHFVLISLFIFFIGSTHGQLLNKGDGLIQLSEKILISDTYFSPGPENETHSIRTNSYYFTILHGEFGITNQLSLVATLPFARVTVNDLKLNQSGTVEKGGSRNSLSDGEIGVRLSIRKKLPVQIQLFLLAGIPLGEKGDITKETNLQTGDGEFNILSGVKVFQHFSKIQTSAYIAFNKRNHSFSNEIRYGFDVGYRHKKILVKANINSVESLFNDDSPISLNGIFSNHREAFIPGAEFQYALNPFVSLMTSVDIIVTGRNTLKAPTYEIGVILSNVNK